MDTSFKIRPYSFPVSGTFRRSLIGFMVSWMLGLFGNVGLGQMPSGQNLPTRDTLFWPRIQHEVGVSGGLTIGSGLAYRIWLRNFGAMLSLMPTWMENSESYLAGVSLYLVGYQNANSKFFFYQGNHYMSSNRYRGFYGSSSTNGVVTYYNPRETLKDRNWNHGIGVGYEIFRGPGKFNPFGLSMMVGWASYKNFTETNISAELALMYKFSKNAHLQLRQMKRGLVDARAGE
jgi:hypothetical protein